MTRSNAAIIEDLNRVAPPFDDWNKLQAVLDELWRDGNPSQAIPELLAVFERYPSGEDGCGVFWSILHGLESLAGYETNVLRSVQAVPSEFGVIMLGRIRNAKIDAIDNISILSILLATSKLERTPERVREVATKFALPK